MTREEFIEKFVARMISVAGEQEGLLAYATESAGVYFDDPGFREDGPEACADSDMSYWGEDQ